MAQAATKPPPPGSVVRQRGTTTCAPSNNLLPQQPKDRRLNGRLLLEAALATDHLQRNLCAALMVDAP